MAKEYQEPLDSFVPGNEIYAVLNKLKTATNAPARIVVYTKNYDTQFSEIISSIDIEGFELTQDLENDNYRLFKIKIIEESDEEEDVECPKCGESFRIDSDKKINIINYILESKKSNLMLLISNDKNNFFKSIPIMNKTYPIISRVFYRAADLQFLLNKIADKKNLEVKGRECVYKRLFDDKKTIITYKEDTIDAFFKKAKTENSWIDSLEVSISNLGILRISRKGYILYSKPFSFSALFDIFLKTIIEDLLLHRRNQLKNKSRTKESPEVKPLHIKFSSNHFSDDENIQKLALSLEKIDNYESSLVYISDGLAHIMVFDYSNGCGFDIYINNTDSLKIISQTQTTEVALESLIIRINNVFEGELE